MRELLKQPACLSLIASKGRKHLFQRIPLLPTQEKKEEEEWQANAAKLKVVGKEALFTA